MDDDGCTIFVKLLQMADTGEGTTPLHVDLEKAKETAKESDELGKVAELYKNDQTGERVQMCWLELDKEVGSFDVETTGGEEFFVMNGSIICQGTEYKKWGWLRFPVISVEERKTLKAGADGAQVYRKTGHLTDKALSMEKIKIAVDSKEEPENEPESKRQKIEKTD